jgi:probable F420-dependent oxidoreductase
MRFGLFLPSLSPVATPEFLATYAQTAEQAGFSSIWLGEHVVFLDEYASSYPYSEDGRLGLPGDSGLLELFTTLTFLAGVTERVRLGTAVCLVPQRNPVYTAKSVATADWLSGGRVDFGVGIGWLREEFDVLDVAFSGRADRTREYLAVMQACWRDEVSTHHGEHYTLPPCRMYPKPIQQPNPPVYFGGESDGALRRVADLGDGWIGFNHLPDSAGASVQRLERFLADAGRSRADVDVAVSSYLQPVQPSHLPAYRDAGGDQLVLTMFAGDPAGVRDGISKLGDEYIGAADRL